MLSLFQQGIEAVFTFQIFGLVFFGTVVGIIFGAVPGLTSTMAVALFLPVTYSLGAGAGISLLVALFVGGTSGALISAILLKIPGTPSSVATTVGPRSRWRSPTTTAARRRSPSTRRRVSPRSTAPG